jgi:hypothetical protein
MAAPADKIWNLIVDVRNTGRFSPETFEAKWADGATGHSVGARFRGHVRRYEIGPVYWTTCQVTACEPGRGFGFDVLVGDRPVNHWHYELTTRDSGTDVTESFRLSSSPLTSLYYWALGGWLRQRRNLRDMTGNPAPHQGCRRGVRSIFITGRPAGWAAKA